MNNHSLIGVDLAKDVFQICAVNANNTVISNQKLTRAGLSKYMAKSVKSGHPS